MNKLTVLMAAILTVTMVLAAGLSVLPNLVQEAQANPCYTSGFAGQVDEEFNCDFEGIGSLYINEGGVPRG
jgi:hypothetical protein